MLVVSESEKVRWGDLEFKAILSYYSELVRVIILSNLFWVGKMKLILAYRRNEKMKKSRKKKRREKKEEE